MDDWDLMLSELFLFHRREDRGCIVVGVIAHCMDECCWRIWTPCVDAAGVQQCEFE